jgi:ABC-type Mn2+/Zn2+ transport system ATPase subunit
MHGKLDRPALDVRDVSVRYDDQPAVQHVTTHVDPGEVVALVGPNGAGKSSLLHAIMGLVPSDGRVLVHTRRPGSAGIAFVPQRADIDLHFPITVEQVVADGRRPFRPPWRRLRREDRAAVQRALSTVGLDGLERRTLSELSGGQVQRAFIARALAQDADLLLLDEPLSGIDAPTADALVDLLHSLAATGRAIVASTHDLALVHRRFARCLLLNRRLLADGPPHEVLDGERLAGFLLSA